MSDKAEKRAEKNRKAQEAFDERLAAQQERESAPASEASVFDLARTLNTVPTCPNCRKKLNGKTALVKRHGVTQTVHPNCAEWMIALGGYSEV